MSGSGFCITIEYCEFLISCYQIVICEPSCNIFCFGSGDFIRFGFVMVDSFKFTSYKVIPEIFFLVIVFFNRDITTFMSHYNITFWWLIYTFISVVIKCIPTSFFKNYSHVHALLLYILLSSFYMGDAQLPDIQQLYTKPSASQYSLSSRIYLLFPA